MTDFEGDVITMQPTATKSRVRVGFQVAGIMYAHSFADKRKAERVSLRHTARPRTHSHTHAHTNSHPPGHTQPYTHTDTHTRPQPVPT